MKLSNPPQKFARAFTLVELLIVFSIVASLASISSIIIMRKIEDGKEIRARIMGQHIGIASEFFFEDEYCYPYLNGTAPDEDESYISGGKSNTAKVISNLLGNNSSVNSSGTDYLIDMEISKDGTDGLTRASLHGSQQSGNFDNNANIDSIADPWGNPYIIVYDHSGDRVVEADNSAFLEAYKNETWQPANMVIISAGRDGLFNKEDDIVVIR